MAIAGRPRLFKCCRCGGDAIYTTHNPVLNWFGYIYHEDINYCRWVVRERIRRYRASLQKLAQDPEYLAEVYLR